MDYTVAELTKNNSTTVEGIPSKYLNNYDKDFFIPINKRIPLNFNCTALVLLSREVLSSSGSDEEDEMRYYWQKVGVGDSLSCSDMDESLESGRVYMPKCS